LPQHRATSLRAADMAREVEDTPLVLAAAVAGFRGTAGFSVTDPARLTILEDALRRVGTGVSVERARLLAAVGCHTDARQWERRRDLAFEPIDVARCAGGGGTLPDVLIA